MPHARLPWLGASTVEAQPSVLCLEYSEVEGVSLRLGLFRPAEPPLAGPVVVLRAHDGGLCFAASLCKTMMGGLPLWVARGAVVGPR